MKNFYDNPIIILLIIFFLIMAYGCSKNSGGIGFNPVSTIVQEIIKSANKND
jgi:hypothetical protein